MSTNISTQNIYSKICENLHNDCYVRFCNERLKAAYNYIKDSSPWKIKAIARNNQDNRAKPPDVQAILKYILQLHDDLKAFQLDINRVKEAKLSLSTTAIQAKADNFQQQVENIIRLYTEGGS